ncbi:FAD-binding protein [Streptomyces sp. HNM0575]|uniref:FAD-binding protein n=1 Tax=Streptomyces sp. HNM0575 TaxID=2716338 RepID=UPI00145CD724|nr:FAD-binding protein [Streptomyces sp. HNM0575]NLU72595.1 FAD-binding protein [Streptomyces sp. HNM0575]
MPRERSEPSRRTALYGLAGAAAVVGFDPGSRAWATERTVRRRPPGGGFEHVPPLDGELLTDDASRDAAAEDFGHIVHRRPAAVLRPGSVDDVVAMVRFCRRHRIPVAPRGQGHATFGQAQTEGGLVIETSPLDHVGKVENGTVTVGAGARWSTVAKSTLRHGLTPPVFTDYLELSVGGTLSVGGLGGQAHRHGSQADTVTELQVVTGAGESVRCSATRHADLFDAVRAGLGQCAVVVGATLRLVRAPKTVRHFQLPYTDLEVFLEDQRRLTAERRFDYVEGLVLPTESAGASQSGGAEGVFQIHVLEAVAYGPPAGPEPDDERLLAGLRFDSAGMTADTLEYYAFLDRLAPSVADQKEQGLWDDPHPWLNLLLPSASVTRLASGILDALRPEDVGTSGVVLLYPLRREVLHAPLLRMPDDPVPYLLAVLRTGPPDDQATVDRLLAANRAAYETVRDAGGKQYPVGSVPFRRPDWRDHFGEAWPALAAARRRYDPAGILVPGQGIF